MIRHTLLLALLLAAGLQAAAQPRVIAHRGYWTAPGSAQNSIASFTKADSIGVYGSEMDVWLTGDNRLVVNHDQTIRGVGINMARDKARLITQVVLPNGERIPTLDAYLKCAAAHPATRLILELKTLSYPREDIAVRKVVQRLKRYGLLERTDFISFSLNACIEFRAQRLHRVPQAAARSARLLPGRGSLAAEHPAHRPHGNRLRRGSPPPASRMGRPGP